MRLKKGPRALQDGLKMNQEGLKRAPRRPKMAQDGSKMAQDGLKTAQDGLPTAKEALQEGAKTPKSFIPHGVLTWRLLLFGLPTVQDDPRGPQNGPKSAQEAS